MELRARALTKTFGPVVAVDGLDLAVERGEVLALIGPSGCGKTTVLRLIAGFERADDGTLDIGARRMSGPGVHVRPERRGVGLMFQTDALFPHRRVAANVAFGLPRRMPASQRRARVAQMLELVGLTGLERRRPHELSGGQRQRVALARALAPEPAVVLLDEPFAHLDARLRQTLRVEVRAILAEAGVTAVLVTHDREEALGIGDRVAVMVDGRLRQEGPPGAVYRHPTDEDVARLLGDVNELAAWPDGGRLQTAIGPIAAAGSPGDGHARVLLRPDQLHARPDRDGPDTVVERSFSDSGAVLAIRLSSGEALRVRDSAADELPVGARVTVEHLRGEPLCVCPAAPPGAGG